MKVEIGTPEIRFGVLKDVEVREAKDGSKSPGGFSGYAAVYGARSLDLGGFVEVIEPTAFDAAIAEDDVRALVNHDRNLVLARSKGSEGGTLALSSDETGLRVEIDELPNTSYARDLVELLKRGDVDQMSFGFVTVRDRWETEEDGTELRTLVEARLFDVSPVTFPAYPDTIAEARALRDLFASRADAEIRAGAVLSKRSRSLVEQARDSLTELLDHAGDGDVDEENSAPAVESPAVPASGDERQSGVTLALAKVRLRALEVAPIPYPPAHSRERNES